MTFDYELRARKDPDAKKLYCGSRLGSMRRFLVSLIRLFIFTSVDKPLQAFELFSHFRKTRECRQFDTLFPKWRCRDSGITFSIGNIADDAGHCTKHCAGANMHVIATPDLASHYDIITGGGASSDAYLGANNVVATYPAVMCDHDQVVDFCTLTDFGGPICSSIGGG